MARVEGAHGGHETAQSAARRGDTREIAGCRDDDHGSKISKAKRGRGAAAVAAANHWDVTRPEKNSPAWWAAMLRSRCEEALRGTPLARAPGDASREADAWGFIEAFRDSAGNRRPVDRAFLMHTLGLRSGEWPTGAWRERHPDAGLWAGLAGDRLGAEIVTRVVSAAHGPLFPESHALAIEMWTEAELCGLHALTWHARHSAGEHAMDRVVALSEWLIAEVQPDNATNHPWGVHWFAWMSTLAERSAAQRDDARMYAETLLHNALVSGELDAFSACILWDSARWLDGCDSA